MILSAIWNKLNEFTELHERSECNSFNEFNLFQMARKIISFDNDQMGHPDINQENVWSEN